MSKKILPGGETKLEYVGGGSDKLYIVHVVETSGGDYITECYYGRRGATLTLATKYRGGSSATARAEATKVINEKTRKGYTPFHGSIPGMPSSAATSVSASLAGMPPSPRSYGGSGRSSAPRPARDKLPAHLMPMLASAPEEVIDLEKYISYNDIAFQRKYDGVRCVLELYLEGSNFVVNGYNRNGLLISLPQKVVEFMKLYLFPLKRTDDEGNEVPLFGQDRPFYFDGELMGDTYRIFDCLTLDGENKLSESFCLRHSDLEEIFIPRDGNEAHDLLAPTAFTPKFKRKMLEQARAENWEGLILRNVYAEYAAGTRSENVLKYKFWESATCRVLGVNDKRSIQLGMLQYGTLVNVGNCTVPANQIIPEVDSLVEVRYLYAHESGSLFQPTLLCVRADKDLPDDRTTLRTTPPEKRGVAFA